MTDAEEPMIIKEGWVHKSDPAGKRWRKRWVVLSTAAFAYYTKPDKLDLKGAFNVGDFSFTAGWTLLDRKAPTPHVFSVHTPKRVYYFAVSNDEEVFRWGRAFEEVKHSTLADLRHEEGGWEAPGEGGSEEPSEGKAAAPASWAPAGSPPTTPSKVKVFVEHRGGGAAGTDVRVTLKLPAAKLGSIRVLSLKKALATKKNIAVEDISLFRDAAAAASGVPLADSASCDQAGIGPEGPPLVMVVAPPSPLAAAAAAAEESAPFASLAVEEPPAVPLGSPVPVAARIARRMALQRVFAAQPGASTTGGALSGSVPRKDFVQALESDPEVSAWRGAATLLAKLEAPGPGRSAVGGGDLDPTYLTWSEVCDVLHEEHPNISAGSDATALHSTTQSPGPGTLLHQGGEGASAGGGSPSRPPAVPTGARVSPPSAAEAGTLAQAGGDMLGVSETALRGAMGPPPASTYGDSRVVMKVDVEEGVKGEVSVGVHDEASAVAAAFLHQHAPSADPALVAALTTEVLHALVEVHGVEAGGLRETLASTTDQLLLAQTCLAAVLRAAQAVAVAAEEAGVRTPQGQALTDLPSGAAIASSAALAQRVADRLMGGAGATTTPGARGSPGGSPSTASGASGGGADASLSAALRHELAASRAEVRELQLQLAAAKEEASEAREAARSAYHATSTDAAVLTRDEWRAWAKEKRELIAAANADRKALMAETARLRDALRLTPGAEGTEARLRALDEDRARLNTTNAKLAAHVAALEGEIKNLYGQWEADQKEWVGERGRLTAQLADVTDAATGGRLTSISPAAVPDSLVPASRAQLDTLRQELEGEREGRAAAVKNWSEETEVLTQLWSEDKAAWAAEREMYRRQIHALKKTAGTPVDEDDMSSTMRSVPGRGGVSAVSPLGYTGGSRM